MISYLEGTLDPSDLLLLDVKGLAVQSEELRINGSNTFDQMTYIYETYLKEGV